MFQPTTSPFALIVKWKTDAEDEVVPRSWSDQAFMNHVRLCERTAARRGFPWSEIVIAKTSM